MPQVGNRKRPAPGASPLDFFHDHPPDRALGTAPFASSRDTGSEQHGKIEERIENRVPPTSYPKKMNNGASQSVGDQLETSAMIARRTPVYHFNNQMAQDNGVVNAWSPYAQPTVQPQAQQQPSNQPVRDNDWVEDIDDLRERAQVARKEALQKRKVIPPFIQKLRSFLDQSRNTKLIHWSSDGESFVVEDEDEFARTLIPELFKHNNYASFVRQLNMYGFHKKVGLSDNSMRASEKKAKSPSEYSNQFFKQGEPDLMWLIQKPKPAGKTEKGTRARQEQGDAEDGLEDLNDIDSPRLSHIVDDDVERGSRQPMAVSKGPAPADTLSPEKQLQLQRTLQSIQQNQQIIASTVQQLRRDHDRQAVAFEELHRKHENSINAILTFLATIYSKTLQSGQDPAKYFPSAMMQDLQNQSGIVDLGDYTPEPESLSGVQLQRPPRRQPLLLHAPPEKNDGDRFSVVSPATSKDSPTVQPSVINSPAMPPQRNRFVPAETVHHQPAFVPTSNRRDVSALPANVEIPANFQNPEQDFMSLIHSTNTNNTKLPNERMDFSEALSHLENLDGQAPLTPTQRQDALQSMVNGTKSPLAIANGVSDKQLDSLEKSLRAQDTQIANLSRGLSPLSPSGSIPGLPEGHDYMSGNPDDFLQLDPLFGGNEYFNEPGTVSEFDFSNTGDVDFSTNNLSNDFDFASDSPGVVSGHHANHLDVPDDRHRIETVTSSEATSPANTADGGPEHNDVHIGSPRKKRRKQ